MHQKPLEGLLKYRLVGPIPSVADSYMVQGLRISISSKFLYDVDGPETTLCFCLFNIFY